MSDEPTGFLYPMIDGDGDDPAALLEDLTQSATDESAVSGDLAARTLADNREVLAAAAEALTAAFGAGGRLFTFGNGGSATDAAGVAALFSRPPTGRPVAARSLVDDVSVVTALANDLGFELVFSRQLIAHGRAGDVALGLSTSGNSDNVVRAFAEARQRGLTTVGLAGYDGGAMATCGHVDHLVVVRADSVHRIQEAQAAVAFALWEAVQARLEPELTA